MRNLELPGVSNDKYHSVKNIPEEKCHEFKFQKFMWNWILKHLDKDSPLARSVDIWHPPREGDSLFGINKECEVIHHDESNVTVRAKMADDTTIPPFHGNFHLLTLFIEWFYSELEKGRIEGVI